VAHGVLSDTGVTNEHSAKSENKQRELSDIQSDNIATKLARGLGSIITCLIIVKKLSIFSFY
jgi:hypothetical protein